MVLTCPYCPHHRYLGYNSFRIKSNHKENVDAPKNSVQITNRQQALIDKRPAKKGFVTNMQAQVSLPGLVTAALSIRWAIICVRHKDYLVLKWKFVILTTRAMAKVEFSFQETHPWCFDMSCVLWLSEWGIVGSHLTRGDWGKDMTKNLHTTHAIELPFFANSIL